ncbi:excinuclease ABC subunit UvrC [Alkalitalea saponilacus]|uniref:UvrABC system protein C n=1 Tax=Alkalitalea saponilacus TaxID=889453 RepID=A0A1T5EAI6_9BACT|nr:excinuclease ABC subunit UvrC [Alkalitalea saponilacus]ASB49065.1 excinuclease ABC subunit C [Alkalitalea saponilacus]SKB80715.1 Excinuclease ABC subunit C [Alkalitalea saponilacus]
MEINYLNEHIDELRELVTVLPNNPGVYQFFDTSGKIIYVGKAKNLKRRVASYFNREPDNGKTRVLVKRIRDIRHIVVDSEEDALLLENNLIKKYQPRYNVLLKDDKSFPWIVIRNEPYPRVYQTRQLIKDGSQYFGPYTNVMLVRSLIDLFRHLYPIRTCRLNLIQDNITQGKFKRCLEFHIGNCKAPCEGLQTEQEYLEYIVDIRNILKGNIGSVIRYLKERMLKLADEYKFEEAENIKQRLNLLSGFQSKSTIVNPKIDNVDVFSIISDDKSAYVNFLKVLNGAIIQAHTIELKKKLNETDSELLSLSITEIRERLQSSSREIIVPFIPEVPLQNVEFVIPKIGDKKKLLELSERNVKYYRLEKLKQDANRQNTPRHIRLLENVKADLRLKQLPVHIECFDNSNFQGSFPVAACVVFKNGIPSKRDYRHFNIKTVEGPDDFASMEEVVERRYRRLMDEGSPLPQLIVIDGGKGQLGSAVKALNRLNLSDRIAIIGIAKKLEEIFRPGDPIPLYLDKNSQTLKLIQNLRNEAHRFGITFHRQKRSKAAYESILEKIEGIGPKSIEDLMREFKSINGIKSASVDDLHKVVGSKRANSLIEFFKKAGD